MRRFLALAVLCVFSLPVGLSIAGCGHNPNNYCIKNGHAYGVTTTQPVYAVMQPETTGLALSWGQTGNIGSPAAYNCNGGSANISHWTYASSNLLLADISPTGSICAGTWNRNSPGGTNNFTICTPPSGATLSAFNGCTSTSCGTVQITATGGAVTTNPVDIYVHPPITSMSIPSQSACISQGQSLGTSLLAETTVVGPGGVVLCSPSTTACTNPAAHIGTITYAAVNGAVVNIDNTTDPTDVNPVTGTTSTTPNPNGLATANLPGSTIITATNSDVTSAAGYFSSCPPAKLSISVNGATSTTVTPSSPQTLLYTATDINNKSITGLSLSYASTQQQNLTVNNSGTITATFPSHASVSAVCQPPSCNESPINLVGFLGNGMPVTSNLVTVNSPGRVTNQIWMASSQSQYFSEVDLTTGTTGAPIELPYTPNSMVMDPGGDTLYFGSYHELMSVSTIGNQLSKEVPGVPGVVLAVNPTNTGVIINDQLRQVIYLYAPSSGAVSSTAGIASRAEFSPDGTTAYIAGVNPATGQPTLFVNNTNSGWTQYPLSNETANSCPLEAAGTVNYPAYNPAWDPFCGPSVAITVPSEAAFLSGTTTAARSFCPNSSSTPIFYPPAGDTGVATAQVTATADGFHVLGASTSTFSDIGLIHTGANSTLAAGVPTNACPAFTGPPLTVPTSIVDTPALPVTASEIDQVVSSPYANLAFVTYQGTGASGVLPYYTPGTFNGTSYSAGTLSTIQLSTGAQAPVAGIFSPDGSIFFTSTSGDNLIHMINTGTLTDTQTIDPKLTNATGAAVPAQFLAVKSRATT